MNSNKYTPIEGWFFVDIEKASQAQLDSYYSNTGEIKSSGSSAGAPVEFKKATINFTCNEEEYPVGSVWMMGQSPGITINFFGEKLVAIQEKDLYARIDTITKEYLIDNGWTQDKDLYWHKDGNEYNYIDEILTLKGVKESIWNIDTVSKLEKNLIPQEK